MGGSLIELISRGEQDKHLIGNPLISYFKSIYKTHTNFSKESIPVYSFEKPDFGKRITCVLPRKGDLLNTILLELQLPALETNVSWINNIGYNIIKTVEFKIGGETICSMTGEYMSIISDLEISSSKKDGFYKMIGKYTSYTRNTNEGANRLFIPFPFWFCKNIENSLPIIRLGHMDVRIDIEFRPFSECWYSGTSMSITPSTKEITNAILYCDYIFLDTFERKKLLQEERIDYLIEQVQKNIGNDIRADTTITNIDFYFNHPVKEMFWIYQPIAVNNTNDWSNYSKTLDDDTVIQDREAPIEFCKIMFNGNDRFERRHSDFFRLVQQYKYHTSVLDDFVYSYSFSIHPENFQPSGTCNFSKLDDSLISLEFASNILLGEVRFYGINYNIMRTQKGMAGLMYSS